MGRTLRDAWDGGDAELAKKQLQQLAASLNAKHPGAAASLPEGLEDTLTVQGLGITGAPAQHRREIESLKGQSAPGSSTAYGGGDSCAQISR